MKVVRQLSQWHLGYPEWADTLIAAYLDPEPAAEYIDREQEDR